MSIDPAYTVIFGQSIVLNNSDANLPVIGNQGEIRYNKSIDRLQVFHKNNDFIGPPGHWHEIEANIATTNTLGIIKVGNNLTITEDGLLSSLATGVSRIYQNVITIASSNSSAGDYNTIEYAITNALGTFAAGYSDGVITSVNGAPSAFNRYVLLCSPGDYYPTQQIILPPYTSLEGDDKNNTTIYFYTSNIDTYTTKNCIETTNINIYSGYNTFKNLSFTLELDSNTNSQYHIIANQATGTRQNYNFDDIIINDTNTLTTPYTTNSKFIGISLSSVNEINITNSNINFDRTQCSAIKLTQCSNINITNTELKCTISPNINIISEQSLYGINTTLCDNINIDNININISDNSSISNNILCNLYGINSDNNELINITNSTIETTYNLNKDFIYNNTSNINSINIITSPPILQPSIPNCDISINYDNTNNIYVCNVIGSIVPDDLIDGKQIILFNGLTGFFEANNTYFHISGGNSSALIFNTKSFQPSTLPQTGPINIYKLRQVNIYNTILNSTKYLINEDINNTISPLNYPPVIISGGSNIFKSGSINTPNYITTFDYPSIINVSNDTSSTFQTITQALNYITNESTNRRYIIQIQPGKYYENAPIICREYINIIAIDPINTIIYIANDPTVSTNTTPQKGFQLASNMIITGLNIISTAIYNSTAHNYNLFDAFGISNTIIKDCKAILNINCESLNISANNTGYVFNAESSIDIKFDNVYMEIQPLDGSDISTGLLTNTTFNTITSNNSIIDIISSTLKNNVVYTKFTSNTTTNSNISVIHNTSSDININTSYLATCINSSGSDSNNYYSIYCNTAIDSNRHNIEIWDSEIYSKETTLYFSTDCNTTIIANTCNLVSRENISNITNKPINYPSAQLKCNNCYYNYDGIYKTLNSTAQFAQGDGNLSLDDSAGNQYFTTGKHNTIIGVNAGSNISIGIDNTLLGYSTSDCLIDGSNCSYIGSQSGPINNNSNGVGNSSLGASTFNNITSGSYNTAIGFSIASSLTTANNNIISGFNSADSLTVGNNNIITGRIAANKLIDGHANIITGDNAAANLQHGNNNILIGSNVAANSSITSTYSNAVIIGTNAGYNNNADELIAIGLNAGANSTSNAIRNIFIGSNSGMNNTTGDDNTIIGQYSGETQTTADKTTIIGARNMTGYEGTGDMTIVGVNNITADNSQINKSVVFGINNIPLITNGSNIIIVGNDNGSELISSNSVIILGSNALVSNQSNSSYIVIGNDSANAHISGEAVIIGHQAGIKSKGEKLMVMGHQAGSGVDGKLNTYIGYKSGFLYNSLSTQVDKTGDYNLFIGPYTGFNVSSGSRNVVLGSGDINTTTGFLITSGSGNTLLGYGTGCKLNASDNNTFIGSNIAPNMTTGVGNLIFGHSAGHNLVQGTNNIILGYEAEGASIATDIDNVITIGYRAGYKNNEDNQIFIGTKSGYNTIDGPQNIYVGYQAGYSAVSASNNIFLGTEAGYKALNNTKNICIGYKAGYGPSNDNFSSNYNILVGNEAGYNVTTKGDNIMIGNKAGYENSAGGFNIFMGSNVGLNSSTEYSILIGNSSENKGIGYVSTGDNLISIGLNAGVENTTGADNINIGHNAGKNNTAGAQNIVIGFGAGEECTSGDDTIKIGTNAGKFATIADSTILIGSSAGENIGSAGENTIAIGKNAGSNSNTSGSIFIGYNAGTNSSDGVDNINIGYNSALQNITGSQNIAIGPYTLQNCGSNVNNIIALGSYAGTNIKSNNCIMIGSNSGKNNTNGTESIYIGVNSGNNNELSSYNIGIGNNTLSYLNANSISKGGDIAIGHNAGSNIGSSFNNISSTNSNASPFNNTIIGYSALSQGDISSNNIVFGSRAAEFVDNPAEFANNIITGAGAAVHSNNSINSIIIGANTNNVGSGGQYNILIGANSGQLLGNPGEAYYNLKDATQTINANFANLAVSFTTASANIKYGSGILLVDNKAWFRSNVVALYPIDAGGNTQVIFDSRLPTNYSFSPTSHTNVAITSNIYDKYGFGRNDVSIAGESIIIGTSSANNLTSGSKNTSVGAQTMISNEIGKYNNIFGARAGYYVQTDNNTCIGTQAGASIDYYLDTDENTVYTSSDYVFESNTNSISSIVQTFSGFQQGTVFDVLNSNSNNGRYNILSITSNTTSNIVTVEGFPKIQDDGVTNTIPSNSLKLVSGPYNFISDSIISNQVEFGIGFERSDLIKIYNAPIISNIDNAKIIKITGSKYNDGIYYVGDASRDITTPSILSIRLSGFSGIAYLLISELQGNTITISSISISSSIITQTNFDLIPINGIFYSYFDNTRGQYSISNEMNIMLISTYINNGIYLLNEPNWTTTLYSNNILYTNGQGYYNTVNYVNNTKYISIRDSNIIFTDNNVITFTENLNSSIFDTLDYNTYYEISGTLHNNIIIKILTITDNVIYCDTTISTITNEIVDASTNLLVLTREYITVSGSNNIVRSGKIVAYNQKNKIINPSNHTANFIFDCNNGSYITKFTNSDILQFTTPKSSIKYGSTTPYSWSYSDTNIYLSNINANYISCKTLSFQSYTFLNKLVSLTSNTITASSAYEFNNIIAPVMIYIDGTYEGYYLVDSNPYPFDTLYIGRESPLIISGSVSETANIYVNSISNYARNLDISNVIKTSNTYTIVGSRYNNNITFTTFDYPSTITRYSAFINGNIVNDCWDGNNLTYIPVKDANSLFYDNLLSDSSPALIYGKFTNFDMEIPSNSSNSVVFDNIMSNITISTANADIVRCLDYIQSQDMFRLYDSSNSSGSYNKLYYVSNISNVTVSGVKSYYINVSPNPGTNITIPNPVNIRMNQFRSNNTWVAPNYSGSFYYNNLFNYIGANNSKYINISIGQLQYPYQPGSLSYEKITYNNKNYTLDYNDNPSQYSLTPYPTYTTSSYLVLSFVENCNENLYLSSNITLFNYYISISQGEYTGLLNQYYLTSQNPENTNKKGFTSFINRNQAFKLSSSSQYDGYFNITANLTVNSSELSIEITDLTLTSNQNLLSIDSYGNSYYPYDNPFQQLTKGVLYKIYAPDSINNNKYFEFDGLDISNNKKIYYKNTSYDNTTSLISETTVNINNTLIFTSVPGIHNEHLDISSIGGVIGEPTQAIYLTRYESLHPLFNTNVYSNTDIFQSTYSTSSFLPCSNSFASSASPFPSTYISQGFNTLIFKSSDITNTSQTHIYFSNISITNAALTFNNSTHTITSTNPVTANLAVFNASQYIQLSNSSMNYKEYFLISTTSPTSSNIIIEPTYSTAVLPANGIYTIKTHTINSSEITTDDLSVFNPGQKIIISQTTNNNRAVIIEKATYNNPYSLYIDDSTIDSIITEIPEFCTLERSVIIDETGSINVELKQIGEPLSGTVNSQLVKYHYEDAEGNNLMIGSFAGNYCGRLTQSIYNTYIGAKVGQVNHGSGNIFLGNESGFAPNELEGATYYNNKLAIYKNNSIGISSNPLIGGDFVSNRVGINTIDPDSLVSGTISVTDTKLVVNGKARAYAFTSFTGIHDVTLSATLSQLVKKGSISQGMILISSGKVQKPDIINTIVECDLPNKDNDKRVYGVYMGLSDNNIYSVASLGEGSIWVCNINGNIENGDYISSCGSHPGYGMRQEDDLMHSYTVAKATENIEWDINIPGVQYALIGCTYHCG